MIARLPFLGIGSKHPFLHLFMGSWLCTLLQKSNNTWWKSSIFQTCAASCRCLRFWQISSVSHGVSFLILGFNGMVSAAIYLHANSKWLYFVLALFVRVVSCRAANLFFTLVIRCCVFQGCLLDVSSRMEKCCRLLFIFSKTRTYLGGDDTMVWRYANRWVKCSTILCTIFSLPIDDLVVQLCLTPVRWFVCP